MPTVKMDLHKEGAEAALEPLASQLRSQTVVRIYDQLTTKHRIR